MIDGDAAAGSASTRSGTTSGNEAQRLELLEAHRVQVLAQLESVTENLRLIDHKIAGRWPTAL
ncbi:MAG TPA: hypothetical protein VGH76_17225 [Actinomycetospora sp.]|uniref:hypothetical protein n=1 Tax=Actinomycetospora sp. TaxID=1872135 RepID=UPI002F42CF22